MNVQQREEASSIRHGIHRLLARMGALFEEIDGREPFVKGSLYPRARQCGRKGCRCGRGQLHVTPALSYSESGHTKHVSLRGADQPRLKRLVEQYRRFREARAELGKTWQTLLDLVNQMESLRRIDVEGLLDRTHHPPTKSRRTP